MKILDKYAKGGEVKVLKDKPKVAVKAPKGFHWMLKGGEYFLMEGDYAPHEGAVEEAMFSQVSHPKK